MATVTAQDLPVSGVAAVAWSAASAGGDEVPTGTGLLLLVNNTDTAAHTLTITTPVTVRGIPVDDVAVTVAAGDVAAVPLADVYRNPSTRRAALSWDAATGVELAAVRIPV